jgi:anti-anti-sigma factor
VLLVVHAQSLASGVTALRAVGVIDQATAPLLAQRLVHEARTCRIQPAHLLLDLREVTFLDDIGLDTLLRIQTRLTDGFATLELLEPTPGVVRLLHEAHLDGASWMPTID